MSEETKPVMGFTFEVMEDGTYKFGQLGCDGEADLLLLTEWARSIVLNSAIKNKAYLKKKE